MALHVAKSLIGGILATVIGGLILMYILRQTGFFQDKSKDEVEQIQVADIAESFSFYSPVLTFFESGPVIPHKANRVYADSFPASTARYINWELNLNHSELKKRTPVNFLVIYRHSDGSEFGRAQYDNFAEAGWSSSMYTWSWGADEPGVWKPDIYTVEIFYRGNSVVKNQFVVY
ncbi:MAG: hypothetical protein IPI60_08750 [Saprospiraceae bacterium]|nr:hypothetical protein [Saprospiraceae bacterium]